MTRLARIVVPGLPHHVTRRGNWREAIFFADGDHELYRDFLAEQALNAGVEVWAYYLMPNHVYLVMTPENADGLSRAIGEAHRSMPISSMPGALDGPTVSEPLCFDRDG